MGFPAPRCPSPQSLPYISNLNRCIKNIFCMPVFYYFHFFVLFYFSERYSPRQGILIKDQAPRSSSALQFYFSYFKNIFWETVFNDMIVLPLIVMSVFLRIPSTWKVRILIQKTKKNILSRRIPDPEHSLLTSLLANMNVPNIILTKKIARSTTEDSVPLYLPRHGPPRHRHPLHPHHPLNHLCRISSPS